MAQKLFGVAVSGAEFGQFSDGDDGNIPGTKGTGLQGPEDYWYDTTLAQYQYFVSKGMNVFRIPFLWERVVRTRGSGIVSTADIAGLKAMLDTIQQAGGVGILDMHNYGRYNANGSITILPGTDTTLATDWAAIMAQPSLLNHPILLGIEIMNEPHQMPDGSAGWAAICQRVINAIRTVDTKHTIFVPGYEWQSGDNWTADNPNFPLTDPNNNLIYTAHIYFDGNASGGYWFPTSGIDPQVGVTRLSHFEGWLRAHNQQGLVSEGGIPFGPGAPAGGGAYSSWATVLDNFLAAIMASDVVQGFIPFGAGINWGNWNNVVEPLNNGQFVHGDASPQVLFPAQPQDQPSMSIYKKYPSTNTAVVITPPTTPPTTTPSPTPTPGTPAPIVTTIPTFDVHANFAIAQVIQVISQDQNTLIVQADQTALQRFKVNQQVTFAPPASFFLPNFQTAMIARVTQIQGNQISFSTQSPNREDSQFISIAPNFLFANTYTAKVFTDIENWILSPVATSFYLQPQAAIPQVNKNAGQLYIKQDNNLYYQDMTGREFILLNSATAITDNAPASQQPPATTPPTSTTPPVTTPPPTPPAPTTSYQDGSVTLATTNALTSFDQTNATNADGEAVTVSANAGPDGKDALLYTLTTTNSNEVGVRKDLSNAKTRVLRFNFKVDPGATIPTSQEHTMLHFWKDNYSADLLQLRIAQQTAHGDNGFVFLIRTGTDVFATARYSLDHFQKGVWYSVEIGMNDNAFWLRVGPYAGTLKTIIEWYGFSNAGLYMGVFSLSKFFSTTFAGKYLINDITALQDYVYPTFPTTDATMITNLWNAWKLRYVRSDGGVRRPNPGGVSGTFQPSSDIVSEGIGYALLFAVQNNDQVTFDLIYTWAKTNMQRAALGEVTATHLMGWHYDDVNNVIYDHGWATDAEGDVALALIWAAHRKTKGDTGWATSAVNYNTEATNIIADLKTYAFRTDSSNGNNYQTTDSQQGSVDPFENNPSYVSPGTLQVFKAFTNDTFWDHAVTGAYDLFMRASVATLVDAGNNNVSQQGVGLVPDWVNYSPTSHTFSGPTSPSRSTRFSYDGFRTHFRIRWHYDWYQAIQALNFFNNGAKAFYTSEESKNNGSIWAEYNHDGSVRGQYEKSMMTAGAYFVLTANDANNAAAQPLFQNKIQPSVLYRQSPAGDFIADSPTPSGQFVGQPSYFSDSWMLFTLMMLNSSFQNF